MTVLFIGTDGNDNFTGTGVGQIFGLEGADTLTSALNPVSPGSELFGNSGNDYLESEGIGDTARGGQDNDYLVNTSGQAWLFGDLGDDTIYGDEDRSTLFGGAGADYILTNRGQNLIFGDLRDDFSIRADGSDTVPGNDTIVGLDGQDTMLGGGGNDYIVGGANGQSLLFGNQGEDSLYAGGDADSLQGGQGSDYLLSGSGATNLDNLFIAGNLGQDSIIHLNGGDKGIFGGDLESGTSESNNNDYIFVADGAGHQLYGNTGDDSLVYGGAGSDANVSLFGGQGNDVFSATGGATGLYISGDRGQDSLNVAASNSTLIGGAGTWSDTLNLISGDNNMLMGANGSDASDDYLMVGSGVGNTLAGGEGNDYLMSAGGNVLNGGSGNDTYIFGAGDTIVPDTGGNNTYFGLAGADAVQVTLQAGDTVLNGASGQFTFSGDDSQVAFIGTGGAITGNSKDLVGVESATSATSTGDGNDTINIGVLAGGTVNAGAGDDVVNLAGSTNMGDVFLGSGSDTLTASIYEMGSIVGGAGDDVFDIDTLTVAGISDSAGSNTFNIDTLTAASITSGDDTDLFTIQAIGSGASINAGGGDERIVIETLISNGQIGDADAIVVGGAGNDTISIGLNDNDADGTTSAVSLDGGLGNDLLAGNPFGGDTIIGGDGDDQLFGGFAVGTSVAGFPLGAPGSIQAAVPGFYDGDLLDGGAGADIFVIESLAQTGSIQQSLTRDAIGETTANTLNAATPGIVVGTGGAGFLGGAFGTGAGLASVGSINAAVNVDTLTNFDADDRIAIDTSIVDVAGLGVMNGTIASDRLISYSSGSLVGAFNDGGGANPNPNIFTEEFGSAGGLNLQADKFYYQTTTGGLYYSDNGNDAFLVAVLEGTPGAPAALNASQLLITGINTTGGVATDIVIL